MIAPRAFVIDEEAHSATADAVMLAGSKLFLLNVVALGYVVKLDFDRSCLGWLRGRDGETECFCALLAAKIAVDLNCA